jgi:hypothetical protein
MIASDRAASQAPTPSASGGERDTVTQTGRLTAISDTSVTAQSSNGYTRSYRITPDTATIDPSDHRTHSPSAQFSMNEAVTIVATLANGAATATAVADQSVVDGNGPPMDGDGSD